MDEDMNDIFQKLNGMLSDEETRSNLKNILGNISSSNTDNAETQKEKSSTQNNFDFDIQTLLKLQSIMKSMNDNSNDSRTNLLQSLKPYLRDSKKEKVDQYIKMLNVAKIFEIIGPLGGDSKKNDE